MRTRRTCTSAVRKVRSAAISPWRTPNLLIVIGSRAVCQADCSGIGYRSAKAVININGDLDDVSHYNNTLALPGDITQVAERLAACVAAESKKAKSMQQVKAAWLADCG